jgi:hypothetical protein
MESKLTLTSLPTSDFAPVERVRVWPAHEGIRKVIYHPTGRIRFRETLEESVEWPNDAFTKRRIIDGDVFLTPPVTMSNYIEEYPAEQGEKSADDPAVKLEQRDNE